MDKPTINSLLLILLFIGLSTQANQVTPKEPLGTPLPFVNHFLDLKDSSPQNVIIDTSEPIPEEYQDYPPPLRTFIEQSTVAENIFMWFYSIKELNTYDLKNADKNDAGKQHLKRIYQLSDQQLAILQSHALKAMNEMENLYRKDKAHKCQQFSKTFNTNRQLAVDNFAKNVRKTPIRDKYLHQTYQQITKQITHLDGLIAKIHQTHQKTIKDSTPEDYDWVADINGYCNTNFR